MEINVVSDKILGRKLVSQTLDNLEIIDYNYTIDKLGVQMTSWNKTRVRKENSYGTVVDDINGRLRILVIKMDDGTDEKIVMSNVGGDPDPEELSKWEWYWDKTEDKKWYSF